MTKKFSIFALGLAGSLIAGQVFADMISVSQVGTVGSPTRKVTATEAGDPGGGAPTDGDVYEYSVTTDNDILSVWGVQVALDGGAELFNIAAPFGSNTAPPDPAFIALRPALTADSWITTPGSTSLLGADLPGDGVNTTFGDLSNDGPQTDFVFARLTVPAGATGTFRGNISILGADGNPFDQAFEFAIGTAIPEPSTIALGALGLLGFVAARRRRAA